MAARRLQVCKDPRANRCFGMCRCINGNALCKCLDDTTTLPCPFFKEKEKKEDARQNS